MIEWEGADLCIYYNGNSLEFGLSDIQFAIVSKILGMEFNNSKSITCYSDETLIKFMQMKSNPLRFEKVD